MKLRHERGARTAATVAALLLALPATAAGQSDTPAGIVNNLPVPGTSGPPISNTDAAPADEAPASCAALKNTRWWRITGTGGLITLSTQGSTQPPDPTTGDTIQDTVIAVYVNNNGAPTTPNVGCDDDILGSNRNSRLTFQSAASVSYLVQVGTFNGAPGVPPAEPGALVLNADIPPDNDNRAAAELVAAGSPVQRDNFGATDEPGDAPECGPTSPSAASVWFRFSAPGAGTAVFTSGGFDTVMYVFRGSETTPLACNDDVSQTERSSRISLGVTAGDYLIQISGFNGLDGPFTYSAEFTPAPPPPPPAPLGPPAPPAPPPVVTPGETQTQVVRPPRQIAATALLRATPTGNGIRVRSLTVNAGRGARISIRCAPRRACPAQSRTARNVRFRAFRGRRLRAGTRIQIRVTRRNAIGRYIEYRITRGNFRRQPDRCIPVGSTRPQRRCR